jgi:hypothetical protein
MSEQTDTILHAGELFLAWEGGNEDDPENYTFDVMRASIDFDVVNARDSFIAVRRDTREWDDFLDADAFRKWLIVEGVAVRVEFRVLQVGRYGDMDVRLMQQGG